MKTLLEKNELSTIRPSGRLFTARQRRLRGGKPGSQTFKLGTCDGDDQSPEPDAHDAPGKGGEEPAAEQVSHAGGCGHHGEGIILVDLSRRDLSAHALIELLGVVQDAFGVVHERLSVVDKLVGWVFGFHGVRLRKMGEISRVYSIIRAPAARGYLRPASVAWRACRLDSPRRLPPPRTARGSRG